MKIPCENMSRAAHTHHMPIICFTHLLTPYIVSFLLLLKMEYGNMVKWVCPFKSMVKILQKCKGAKITHYSKKKKVGQM